MPIKRLSFDADALRQQGIQRREMALAAACKFQIPIRIAQLKKEQDDWRKEFPNKAHPHMDLIERDISDSLQGKPPGVSVCRA